MWPFRKKKRLCIGDTANCVNCGKPLPKYKFTGSGYTVNHKGEIIMARFCNGICLRDLGLKMPGWNGMRWMDEYGIILHDEPFEL